MKFKYLIILSLCLITLLAGCQQDETTTPGDPFVTGTRGLVINFVEGQPPEEVYDDNQFPFDINIKLENVGGYDIQAQETVVRITGLDPEEFGKYADDFVKNPEDDLDGTKKDGEGNVFPGTTSYVTFEDLNFQDKLEANFNPMIKADVCYKYGTTVLANLCIKEDILETEEDKVCEIKESKKVHNSGAPIQVTSFKETPVGKDKVGFSFKIEHKGMGKYYLPYTDCDSDYKIKNRVSVTVETGLEGLSCSGLSGGESNSGELILSDAGTSVTCTQEVTSTIDYEKRIKILINYDYKESNSLNILIKATGTME